MYVWIFIKGFVLENRVLVLAACAVFLLFLVAAIIVAKTGRSGVYLAFSSMAGGGFTLFALFFKIDFILGLYTAATLCVLAGILYFFAFCALLAKGRGLTKKYRLEEEKRRLQYTLPDRENSYVQARLNTVLCADCGGEKSAHYARVNLGYARKLLSAVKEKPLSAGERLQAEDIGKSFGLYVEKSRWSATDLRAVNEAFSVLMKLCAKYSVGA